MGPSRFAQFSSPFVSLRAYKRHPSHPHIGGDPGWWTWFDQERYFAAATAWSQGNLDPAQHWYLPGYALLGAPFIRLISVHAYLATDPHMFAGIFVAVLSNLRHPGCAPLPLCGGDRRRGIRRGHLDFSTRPQYLGGALVDDRRDAVCLCGIVGDALFHPKTQQSYIRFSPLPSLLDWCSPLPAHGCGAAGARLPVRHVLRSLACKTRFAPGQSRAMVAGAAGAVVAAGMVAAMYLPGSMAFMRELSTS